MFWFTLWRFCKTIRLDKVYICGKLHYFGEHSAAEIQGMVGGPWIPPFPHQMWDRVKRPGSSRVKEIHWIVLLPWQYLSFFPFRLYMYGEPKGEQLNIGKIGGRVEGVWWSSKWASSTNADSVGTNAAIAVCTSHMDCVRSSIRNSCELAFIDASRSMERQECRAFLIY